MSNTPVSIARTMAYGAVALAALALVGCASKPKTASSAPPRGFYTQTDPGGFSLFGGGRSRNPANQAGPAINVNGFLWRATLDTLSFMPLASADPYGGVIITDWYANPEKPDERFKATVYILDSRLRADGLNVSLFKQMRDPAGQWVEAPVAGQTETDVENAILTRARQLRISNINVRG